MPVCVLVLKEQEAAASLEQKLRANGLPLQRCLLVSPAEGNTDGVSFDSVDLLNPKIILFLCPSCRSSCRPTIRKSATRWCFWGYIGAQAASAVSRG